MTRVLGLVLGIYVLAGVASPTAWLTDTIPPPPPDLARTMSTRVFPIDSRGVTTNDDFFLLLASDAAAHQIKYYPPLGSCCAFTKGKGGAGYQDGFGSSTSEFNTPLGLDSIEVGGQLLDYIADSQNSLIREINHQTNITSTAAGIAGVFGYSGDGVHRTSASLNRPMDVAATLNASGELVLYIADTDNHRIRKVLSSIITTIAGTGSSVFSGDGGPATAAGVPNPRSIAVAPDGSLYLSDGSDRIRRIDANGIITTVAGNGNAAYDGDGGPATEKGMNPYGLAIDHVGNVFFADTANHRVRKLWTTGVVEAIAGTGTPGLTTVVKNGVLTDDGIPAVNSKLNAPADVAFGRFGNLYIADFLNRRIRNVDLYGITWNVPGITYGTAVDAAYTATASEPGTFNYSVPRGTVLAPGTHELTATFIPTDTRLGGRFNITRTVTVGKKSLTLKAENVTREFGVANTLPCTLTGVVNNDPITASCTTSANELSPPGTYDIIATLNDPSSLLGRYETSITNGTLTITKAFLTATANNLTREYGTSLSFSGTVVSVRNPELVTVVWESAATSSSPVGTYAITPRVTGDPAILAQYVTTLTPGTLTVTKLPINAFVIGSFRFYGDDNPAFGALTFDPRLPSSVHIEGYSAADRRSPPGEYDILARLTGDQSVIPNIDFSFTPATLQVFPAFLFAFPENQERLYGEPNPALSGQIGATKNGDVFEFRTDATQASGVGQHEIRLEAVGSPELIANYDVVVIPAFLTILPAPLTIAVDDKTRPYRSENPVLTGRFVVPPRNGDPLVPVFSTDATIDSPAGDYTINAGVIEAGGIPPGSLSGNYTIVSPPGTLHVTRMPLTITAANATRPFGQANPALTGTVDGPVGSDVTITYTTTAGINSVPGNYPIVPHIDGSPEVLASYDPLTLVNGTLTVVAPRSETLTFVDAPPRSSPGDAVPLVAYVHREFVFNDMTGNVTFKDGETTLGSAPIVPATAPIAGPVARYEAGPARPVIHPALLNGDLWIDALVLKPGGRLAQFINDGPGFHREPDIVLGGQARAVFPTDFEQDGRLDALTADADGSVRVLRGQADGTFLPMTAAVGAPLSDITLSSFGTYPDFTYAVLAVEEDPAGHQLAVVHLDRNFTTMSLAAKYPAPEARWVSVLSFGNIAAVGGKTVTIFGMQGDGTLVERARYDLPQTATSWYPSLFVDGDNNADTVIGSGAGTLMVLYGLDGGGYRLGTIPTPVSTARSLQPDDIFFPRFGNILVAGGDGDVWLMKNRGAGHEDDPFESVKIATTAPVHAMSTLFYTSNLATLRLPVHFDTLILEGEDLSSASTLGMLVGNAGGTATFTATNLSSGAHSFTATYEETDNFYSSTSWAVAHRVGPRTPTITWPAPAAIQYGTALGATQLRATADAPGTFTYSPPAGTVLAPGTHDLSVTFAPDEPNTLGATATVMVMVNKAPLTVTANDDTRPYGAANPAFTGTIDGAVNGDTFDVTYQSAATAFSAVGEHDIVPQVSGAHLDYYDLTPVNGTLTITSVPLTVVVNDAARGYWDEAPMYTGTVTGIVPGDTVVARFESHATSDSAAGTYAINVVFDDPDERLGNYNVSVTPGTLTISNPMPVVGSLAAASAAAGSGDTWIDIHGGDFVPQSKASLGSGELDTEFVSRARLRARVPAVRLAARGASYVTVNSNGPGGGASDVAAFFVNHTGAPITAITTVTAAGGTAVASVGGLTATASGVGRLTLAKYGANPGPAGMFASTGEYFTVFADAGSLFTSMTVVDCSMNAGNRVLWFDGAAWRRMRPQTYDASTSCATLTFNGASVPAIGAFGALYFAAVEDFAAPITVAASNVTVNESSTAANSGTVAHVDDGDGVLTASIGTITQTGNSWSWSFDTSDGPAESQTVTISGDNGYGGAASITFDLVVENVAPVPAIAGAPAASDEGTAIALAVGVTEPSLVDVTAGIATGWTVTKNGAFFVSGSGPAIEFTPDDQGTYVVSVTTSDKDGGVGAASASIEVANVNPTASFEAQSPVKEGGRFALSLTLPVDPAAADLAAGFQYAFDCGDGAGYGAFDSAESRTCATTDNGTRAVRAQIRDKDGGLSEYTAMVTIDNVAPTATFMTTDVNEGTPYSLALANAADPSADDAAAGFTYAFDCGNGAGEFSASNVATCPAPESQTIAVAAKVRDKDGAVTEYTGTVTVNNVAPAPAIGAIVSATPPVITPGVMLTFGGSFSDPGMQDSHRVTWDFGDGSTESTDLAAGASHAFSITHAYLTAGTFTVTLTVADDEGGTMSSTATVLVETPAAAAVTLVNTVNTLPGLSGGEKNSLTSKLNAAAKANTTTATCGQHDAFINQVNALVQSSRLARETADALIAADQSIRLSLGCP